jgi:hypothetical protein
MVLRVNARNWPLVPLRFGCMDCSDVRGVVLCCVAVCSAFAAVDDALLRVIGLSKGGIVVVRALCLREEKERNTSGHAEGEGVTEEGRASDHIPWHKDIPFLITAIALPPLRRSNLGGYFHKSPTDHRMGRTKLFGRIPAADDLRTKIDNLQRVRFSLIALKRD